MAMAMATESQNLMKNITVHEPVEYRFNYPQSLDQPEVANYGDDEDKGMDSGNDRFFLSLCTLFVATIEDAKDRISQLELVFCNQLFPAFQSQINRSSSSSSLSSHADQKKTSNELRADMNEECKSKREDLLLQELRALRDERDSLLNREKDRSHLACAQIDKLVRESENWKKKHDDVLRELQDLRSKRVSLLNEPAFLLDKLKESLGVQNDAEEENCYPLPQVTNDKQTLKSRNILKELHDLDNEWISLMRRLNDQERLRAQSDVLREQLIGQDEASNQKIQAAESEPESLWTELNELHQQLRQGAEELIRKIQTVESESESLRAEISELHREAEETVQKIHAAESESESLRTEVHGLHQQLREAKESEKKIQAVVSESPECISKLQQENVDLHKRCSQLCSELNTLKMKMNFSSSSLSGSQEKGSDLKKENSEEMSCDSLKKKYVMEMEKERSAKQALLNKFSALKKSYRSLRKQYTVLFRRTHPMGLHHEGADFESVNEKKVHHIHHGDAENEIHAKDDHGDGVEVSNWKGPPRCIEPSNLNLSRPMENEDDPDQKPFAPLLRRHKIQPNQVVYDLKLGKSILKDAGMATSTHCSPQKRPYSAQNENTCNQLHLESKNDHEDDITPESAQDLANMDESAYKYPYQEDVFEHRMIGLDEASQVGMDNVHPFNLLQPNSNACTGDILVEGVESYSPGRIRNTQENQMPTTSVIPFRCCIKEVKDEVSEWKPVKNVWHPAQKRALSGVSDPKATKSLRTKWRSTRTEQRGFDPHDDFLNTPLENALNGNTENVIEKNGNTNAFLHENGKTKEEHLVDCGRKSVSFSQVTTQAPVGHGDSWGEDENENENNNEKEKDKHEEERKQAYLPPCAGSNLKLKTDRLNVEPQRNDKIHGISLKRDLSRAKLLSSSKPGPIYKYIEPVRKKDERAKLHGVECNQCKKFYDAVLVNNGSSGTARCEHHDGVSRHRYRFVPPSTPEGFWNIGFDSDP